MAQPLICDVCGTEPGAQMLTNLGDGSTMILCPACIPEFYAQSVVTLLETGPHEGPRTKCPACRVLHERMTAGVTPMAATDSSDSWPDNPAGDGETATAEQ